MTKFLLLGCLMTSSVITAQITFDPNNIDNDPTTADAANSVTTGDFDGDGDIDVVGAAFLADHFSLYTNDGAGTFTQSTIDNGAAANGARFVTAFDLDEDGDLDILATSSVTNLYLWYENDGSGVFGSGNVIDASALADEAYAIAAADFDNDGDMDVVGGANNGDALAIFSNDGNENFLLFNTLSVGDNRTNGVRRVEAVDLDEDGDADIVVAAFVGDTYSWYENDGSGNFTAHTIDDSVNADGATAFGIGDLDGDGDLDVAAGSNNANQFLWYENDGSENFSPNIIDNSSSYSIGPRGLSLVDLEQDGDMDIIVAAITGDAFAWYENDGSGNFTGDIISANPANSNGAFALVADDIDGDNVDDIVVAANISDAFTWFKTEGVVIIGFDDEELTGINVFPNPVDELLQIYLPNEINEVSVGVFDNNGRQVITEEYSVAQTIELDVKQLSSGLYFLNIQTAEGSIVKKIMKQ